jgi:hypothetical protein
MHIPGLLAKKREGKKEKKGEKMKRKQAAHSQARVY